MKLKNLNFKIFIPEGLDSNILCFVPVGSARILSEINKQTLMLYKRVQETGEYWISKTTLSSQAFSALMDDFCMFYNIEKDCMQLELLRLTLMNPFTTSKESAVDHVLTFCTLIEKEFNEIVNGK